MRGDLKGPRVSVSLRPQAYAQLLALASRNDVSAAWVVRRAITEMMRASKPDEGPPPLPDSPKFTRPRGHSKDGRVSATLDPRTHAQLIALAHRENVPASSMVSQAVDELIKRAGQADLNPT
jgi:hypothetical protein